MINYRDFFYISFFQNQTNFFDVVEVLS